MFATNKITNYYCSISHYLLFYCIIYSCIVNIAKRNSFRGELDGHPLKWKRVRN